MANTSVAVDLSQIRLRVRDDLRFTPQVFAGRRVYVVEDPLSGKFFRLGAAEYHFALQLDGARSAAAALALAQRASSAPLDSDQALRLCEWLLETGLAHSASTLSATQLDEAAQRRARRMRLARLSPLAIVLPLGRPDRLLTWLTPWLGWAISWQAAIAAVLLGVVAAWRVALAPEALWPSLGNVFTPDQTLTLALIWLGLKTLHELAHGLACKKFGGYVPEAGVTLVLLAPKPYMDVTSSWRFRSKWRRIGVASAGMLVECLIASIALIAWSFLEPGPARQICAQVAVIGGVSTLFFNANPLMRFDGYYICCDLLGRPNLSTEGRMWLTQWAKRWLLGVRTADMAPAPGALVRVYGVASFLWRLGVSVAMIVAAAAMFHGLGLALALAAVACWWGAPLWRLARYLARPPRQESPRLELFAVKTAIVLGGVSLLLGWAPWPGATWAPGVVEADPLVIVRAASAGFIRELHVQDGQEVRQGDVIATLANDQLELEALHLKLDIAKSQAIARSLTQRGELAAAQAEQAKIAGLKSQLDEKKRQLASLRIVAPADGQVLARKLASQLGCYLEPGQELCAVAGPAEREVRLSVDQSALRAFHARLGRKIRIRLAGQAPLEGVLASIDPGAACRLSHPALAAPFGGPLTVKQAESGGGSDLELLAPRFAARVVPLLPRDRTLMAGQRCEVEFFDADTTIGQRLYRAASRWVSQTWRDAAS